MVFGGHMLDKRVSHALGKLTSSSMFRIGTNTVLASLIYGMYAYLADLENVFSARLLYWGMS
jgi:hypothetical protein